MTGKTDIFSNDWCEIVFEERNKSYGAYTLRKKSNSNIIKGIIWSIVSFTLAVSAPIIINYIKGLADNASVVKVTEVTTLEAPPPIDKEIPPPPEVPPPPPLKSTVKFTPPVVKPDEEVPQEEPPPTQEEMQDKDASTKTVEGDPNGVPAGLDDGNASIGDDNQVFISVEQMPEFPGGEAELMRYLQTKVVYPPIAKENGIQGKVFITFVIDKDGHVKDVKVIRGIGGGCDEEAIRVVKSMPPWKAGKQNGKAVNVQFSIPIKFSLK
jgi:periplasmic protein TonB